MAHRWLEGSESANWDLAVIYYGQLGTAFTCDKCMHIELGYGAKWKLVYQFTQSGPFADHYVHRYTQVTLGAGPWLLEICLEQSATACNIMVHIDHSALAAPNSCTHYLRHSSHQIMPQQATLVNILWGLHRKVGCKRCFALLDGCMIGCMPKHAPANVSTGNSQT